MIEKQEIIDYIKYMNKNKATKNKYDFKNFFASLQLLLFYLTEKGVMNVTEKISNVIKDAPGYLKLSDDCKNFFYKEGENFTLIKLMNLFFFFEHLCFEDFAETLQPEYKKPIPEDLKTKIVEKLLKQKDEFNPISTQDLAAATRRMISRYLSGNLQVTDFKEDNSLAGQIWRMELWEEKIGKLDDLMILVFDKMKGLNVTLGQAYEFYKIIGEEDRNALNV